MNVLDILLLLACVWFAVVGFRQGFVVGVMSVIGFLGGGLIAVFALPAAWDEITNSASPGTVAVVVAVVIVIICASVGQAFTTHLGNRLRNHITWSPARAIDATGGSLVNVLAMLTVVWLIGSALASTSLPTIGREVRSSKVLLGVSQIVPTETSTWFDDFGSTLAQSGFPQVFTPFANENITSVPAPDPALAQSAVVSSAKQSIVKVVDTAPSCSKVLEGTGFVFAPNRIMTNAHVVGGVDEPTVQIGGEGRLYDAQVVLYDWQRDIAVLSVPSLPATTPFLRFTDTDANSRDDAIVAGYPENGAFDVRAARVRGRIRANGPDIYHRGTVSRDVYSLFTIVRQGNSGGPLLSARGEVTGVIFAKSLDDPETGYALSIDEIRPDIQAGVTATQTVDTQGCSV